MTGHPPLDVKTGLELVQERDRLRDINADLLAALKAALKCFQISTDYTMSAAEAAEFRCKMRKQARAAIARAEGKTDDYT